jgi:hypothetical protein
LFKGHIQPKIPADLGFYDLRVPETREQQARLARQAGVTAFCYWHYWMAGKRLLSKIFDEVLESGKPEFPFCLGWANHSWYSKTWDNKSKETDKLLIKQTYPGIDDEKEHFSFLLKAFKDNRYLKINNKPFFYIFDPDTIPQQYIDNFRKWTKQAGFDDLYLVCRLQGRARKKEYYLNCGYNAVSYESLSGVDNKILFNLGFVGRQIFKIKHKFSRILGFPDMVINYSKYHNYLLTGQDDDEHVLPQIYPNWDNSPRRGKHGSVIWTNTTPNNFYDLASKTIQLVKKKSPENQIIMLKSWNEWGEGNYMEPDLTYRKGYIRALRKAIEDNK